MMAKQKNTALFRNILCIIDANYNRAKEGLRVVEDTCRFLYFDKKIMYSLKSIRHLLTDAFNEKLLHEAVCQRDSVKDIGRYSDSFEMERQSVESMLLASLQRVKESLRVLEEFLKLLDKEASAKIKKLRYKSYELEKNIIKKKYSLCNTR